jgi:hypothetical protein
VTQALGAVVVTTAQRTAGISFGEKAIKSSQHSRQTLANQAILGLYAAWHGPPASRYLPINS